MAKERKAFRSRLFILAAFVFGVLLHIESADAFQNSLLRSHSKCNFLRGTYNKLDEQLLGGIAHRAMSSTNTASGEKAKSQSKKKLILIRHGCSYMNEHIGVNGISFGGPNFTDIFSEKDQELYYRDSPLSAKGQDQAKALHRNIESLLQNNDNANDNESNNSNLKECLLDLDLVVVSPLTRAIQTAQLALLPHISSKEDSIPVIALPLAAERLYLISDVGTPQSALEDNFGSLVDFKTGFPTNLEQDDPWWLQQMSRIIPSNDEQQQQQQKEYAEWRPTGQGQQYFCPGEPLDDFQQRMKQLCQWLNNRTESRIALVGHFGVFEWLLQDGTGDDITFGNCEIQVVDFETILRKAQGTAP